MSDYYPDLSKFSLEKLKINIRKHTSATQPADAARKY